MKEVLIRKMGELHTREQKYNFAREYLHEYILQIIDRKGYFKHLAFTGGTALRIVHDLPRYSEDLDFSLIRPEGFRFDALLGAVRNELVKSGYSIAEVKGKGKTVQTEFIRFEGLLFEAGLSSHRSEKLFVKVEVDTRPPEGVDTEIQLINKSFLFKVRCYGPASLFASKLHAVLYRKHEKGRDYYDLLWFLTRRTGINYPLLSRAVEQTEKPTAPLDAEAVKGRLLSRIHRTDFTRVLRDVRPFLVDRGEAEYFKEEYFVQAVEKYFAGP